MYRYIHACIFFAASCPAGQFSNQLDQCESCPFGRYTDLPDQISCQVCPLFLNTSSVGSTSLDDCLGEK